MTKKRKQKIATPIKPLKGQELRYRRELNKLGRLLVKAVKEDVLIFLKTQEVTYVMDGVGSQLGAIFNKLNAKFLGVLSAGFAENTATQMVTKTTRINKEKFDKSIFKATGVSLSSVIQVEGLGDFVETSVNRNVSLIKSLPEEYLKNVETLVTNGVASGARYSTIAKEIVGIKGVNSKLAGRIKTIAMNELQTINSQLTLRRSDALGIKKGIYRTSDDEKVRPSHKELDGDEYVLSKGAFSSIANKFIQPGITDINCR